MNNTNSLNLYAKIEPLIGFYEDYERLYLEYLKAIIPLNPKNILDFGCGNGRLLEILKNSALNAQGCDLSSEMIQIAKKRGVAAYRKDIREFNESFDLIIAAADVLNYFDACELDDILRAICSKLAPNGYFIADINTLHGFKNVAEGLLVKEEEERFLSVEADFENKKLTTHFTLFSKRGELYKKESQTITQYFHPADYFKKLGFLRLLKSVPIRLFGDEASDKTLMIFQKI